MKNIITITLSTAESILRMIFVLVAAVIVLGAFYFTLCFLTTNPPPRPSALGIFYPYSWYVFHIIGIMASAIIGLWILSYAIKDQGTTDSILITVGLFFLFLGMAFSIFNPIFGFIPGGEGISASRAALKGIFPAVWGIILIFYPLSLRG
jgi:hypothetical protein